MIRKVRAGFFMANFRRRTFVHNSQQFIRNFSSSSSTTPNHPPPASSSQNAGIPKSHPGVGTFVNRSEYLKTRKSKETSGKQLFLRAGLPMILFSLGAWWVVASAIDGKLKERAASRREVSQSERQALMEEEHDDMMNRLNKAAKKDFDNTKRIERPEEILARRKAERDQRNVWYRRVVRWVKRED